VALPCGLHRLPETWSISSTLPFIKLLILTFLDKIPLLKPISKASCEPQAGTHVFKILFAIFVPGPITPGIKVITKLNVAHLAAQHLQPLLALMPKAL
jgi:hypothetical protein